MQHIQMDDICCYVMLIFHASVFAKLAIIHVSGIYPCNSRKIRLARAWVPDEFRAEKVIDDFSKTCFWLSGKQPASVFYSGFGIWAWRKYWNVHITVDMSVYSVPLYLLCVCVCFW